MSKILKTWNKLHVLQKLYVVLWVLFLVFLIVWVFVTAFAFPDSAMPKAADAAKAFSDMKANTIAALALVDTLLLFGALILTVITNGFVLKRKSLFKNTSKGGAK